MEIFDVPGSYLNSDMPEDKLIFLKIKGEFSDIMCELNPEKKKNVRVGNEVKVIQLQLMKALYGCMESTLLWYDKYPKNFKSHGFMVNTYERCIENITIKGKQCTI